MESGTRRLSFVFMCRALARAVGKVSCGRQVKLAGRGLDAVQADADTFGEN